MGTIKKFVQDISFFIFFRSDRMDVMYGKVVWSRRFSFFSLPSLLPPPPPSLSRYVILLCMLLWIFTWYSPPPPLVFGIAVLRVLICFLCCS
ncbi:hypothetical protein P167DRAFT_251287 [Morchella conica CCBAS932]|uniref:Transmembrane protein n=1 Tax=Morchella conica CCBAS932 TaxID=1392247 RepID=A0A3N4KMK1_9PEZI|nr:hypothetical protein P167DRAFT_251287 [Morchella conica CCBAS932]